MEKAEGMMDEGFMTEARAATMKQEREEVHVALQYAASSHCLVEEWKDCEELRPKPKERWSVIDKRSEGMKHRTEWCAEADWHRCVRCGRKQIHEDARKMYWTRILVKKFGKMGKTPPWRS